jgi:cell division protein FtsQ
MKKMNKVFRLIGYCMAVCGVVALLGFVNSSKSDAVCEGVDIEILRNTDRPLITEDEIQRILLATSGEVVGVNLRQIDFDLLENALSEVPFLNHAVVYTNIENQLKIVVNERKPMARLIDENGQSAFLDTDGYLMPVSKVSATRLIVITGKLGLDKSRIESNFHLTDSLASKAAQSAYQMAVLLTQDELWKAQFQQLDVDSNGDITAYPQVGNHQILFGSDRFDEKLDMLRTFYAEGMNEESWNKYKSINLKYKDQIVCTKKYPYGGT